jgi:hypothetical protein
VSDGPRRRWRSPAILVGAALAVVAVAAIVGAPPPGGPPLDPRSAKPDGTKALVLLLSSLGAHVELNAPPPSGQGQVALVLQDLLDDSARQSLRGWVSAGGTLVVTDPQSDLAGLPLFRQSSQLVTGTGVSGALPRQCDEPALGGVGSVDPSGGVLFQPRVADVGCFGSGGGAFVDIHPLGAGTIVAIGGAAAFDNANLGKADNSVLAASLLVPAPGTDVFFVGSAGQVGGGHKHLLDLVAGRVKEAFWQLALAFVLLALWRARRHGRPVADVVPVELPGSELVVAVGRLLQEADRRDRASVVLREQLRADLAVRLGLPAQASPDTVADAVARRAGVDRERVLSALVGPVPAAGADLVRLAQATEAIRQEVLRVR